MLVREVETVATDTAKDRRLAYTIIMNQGFTDDIAGVLSANDDVGAVAPAIQEAY